MARVSRQVGGHRCCGRRDKDARAEIGIVGGHSVRLGRGHGDGEAAGIPAFTVGIAVVVARGLDDDGAQTAAPGC